MTLSKWARSKGVSKEEAHRALSRLPASPTGHGQAVLLPFIDKQSIKEWFGNADINAAIKAAPIAEVPIDGLCSVQHSVQRDRVALYIDRPNVVAQGSTNPNSGTPVDLPVVIQYRGVRVCWDGNHRTVARILMGDKMIRARLVNLDGMKGNSDAHNDPVSPSK